MFGGLNPKTNCKIRNPNLLFITSKAKTCLTCSLLITKPNSKTNQKTKANKKFRSRISWSTHNEADSRCSLYFLSWYAHNEILSLSLLIFADLHTTASFLSFSLQICSLSMCPSRLMHFISGAVAASSRSTSLLVHLRRRWCAISPQPLLLHPTTSTAFTLSAPSLLCELLIFSFLRLAYNRICYPLGFNLLGKMVNVENLCVC